MSILICYDGSESAKHAIAVARGALGHHSAVLLHVWSPPYAFSPDAFGTTSAAVPSFGELDRLARERAEQVAQEGCDLATASGLEVESWTECSPSSAWRTILDVADEVSAELIVIGTRGTTAVQSVLLGSVSHPLVHHSHRPVLVVPRPGG